MKKLIYVLSLFCLFISCNKGNKFEKYEVRIIDINVSDNAKDGLNFLSTNMDPLKENGFQLTVDIDVIVKKYLYFNLTNNKKEIIIKEVSSQFDKKDRSTVISAVQYTIVPIKLLVPENIKVNQLNDFVYQMTGKQTFILKVETLYLQEIEFKKRMYNTENGKVILDLETTTTEFSIDFGSDYEKAAKYASAFKKLSLLN